MNATASTAEIRRALARNVDGRTPVWTVRSVPLADADVPIPTLARSAQGGCGWEVWVREQGYGGGMYLHERVAAGVWLRCYLSGWNDNEPYPVLSDDALCIQDGFECAPGLRKKLMARVNRRASRRFDPELAWFEDPAFWPVEGERDPRLIVGVDGMRWRSATFTDEPRDLAAHYVRAADDRHYPER